MLTDITIQLSDEPELACVAERYVAGGRPAVLLVDVATGEPWCDLTVNLPDYIVPDEETGSFVPEDHGRYLDVLAARRAAEVVGERQYGSFHSRAYMVRFSGALLAPEGDE